MKILIAGGAGFLGSHFCEALLKKNEEVVCVDNYYTGSQDNISPFIKDSNFSFIEHDVVEPLEIKVDGIINLASPASPVQYQRNPVQTIKTNLLGTINLVELATKLRVPIFQASTSEIYGDPLESPQRENYWGNVNTVGVRSCYDEGKRAAETILSDFHRQFGANIKIARIFNTYGPKMHRNDGRVVSNFIVQALHHEPLTIYGNGNQTRSFSFVDDTIDGLIKLFYSDGIHTPVNIGNPDPINMIELAQEIIKLSNSQSKIIFAKLPQDDPKNRQPDITLAQKSLGWFPKISRTKGLKLTIDFFRKQLQEQHG